MLGKPVIFRWVVVAIIFIGGMFWAYNIITKSQKERAALEIFGSKNADGTAHRIADFRLTDQSGKTVSQDDFKNKIYVADFIFTTCEGICPVMSDQMERVADVFKNNNDVKFISHSVKPEEDSVPVLNDYAKLHNANPDQWHFVTGNRSEINLLASKSYLVADTSSEFVHTQFFALIDEEKRIRGVYDGTDSADVNKLIGDISTLLTELR